MAFFQLILRIILPAAAIGILSVLTIVLALIYSHNAPIPKVRRQGTPVHLLIVLGSGGHTTEMFFMLEKYLDLAVYTYRTYVVSSGDQFSAAKAAEFEAKHVARQMEQNKTLTDTGAFDVVTIPRARRVHQSYWTAPFTTLQSFWACLLVLCGRYPNQHTLPWKYTSACPDIILTNGPAVSVCMILAAKTLRFFIFIFRVLSSRPGISRLRTVFVESWARIHTLSTSGVLVLPLADKFLVQWPDLAGRRAWWGMKETSYVGWAVL
ncbi:UDP-N-acetylglucosamine transferase subunit alg14 [Penicillium odoratum]|uniref:UDP-N-acetylglucosamine transferase subunit alg14 n=1 Tax=Penicillium odoratum TaxID=1167516 RepID=UPI0025475AC1|nr:UDP-N-acetylglucosamine transferase subunit alg14 [Penicillium odoratum]KAJ5760163.1 UDP-N-acetylglucosamine transferase subunit alg14 [Penicillium odoratum]